MSKLLESVETKSSRQSTSSSCVLEQANDGFQLTVAAYPSFNEESS